MLKEVLAFLFAMIKKLWDIGGREVLSFLWNQLLLPPLRLLFVDLVPAVSKLLGHLLNPIRSLAVMLARSGIVKLSVAILQPVFAGVGILAVAVEPLAMHSLTLLRSVSRFAGKFVNDIMLKPVRSAINIVTKVVDFASGLF